MPHEHEQEPRSVIAYNGASPGCLLTREALPHLLRTLTDEFAFRRILGIAALALPIQIERHL